MLQFAIFYDEGNAAAVDDPPYASAFLALKKMSESGYKGLKDWQDEYIR